MALQAELADDPGAGPEPVHQGYRAGVEWFRSYFERLETMSVDHVVVGVRGPDPETRLQTFAERVLGR